MKKYIIVRDNAQYIAGTTLKVASQPEAFNMALHVCKSKEAVMINKEMIDLRYVEQIVDSEQVTALGYCMRYAQKHLMNGKKDLRQVIAEMEKVIEKESLDALCESRSSIACMAMPRAQEIFACFDRYRKLKL